MAKVNAAEVIRLIMLLFVVDPIASEGDTFIKMKLLENGYNKDERPFYYEKPVEVTLQVYVHAIGPVDENRFTISQSIYLRQWWIDPRLQLPNNTEYPVVQTASLKNVIWQPDTSVHNTQDEKRFEDGIRTVINTTSGLVYKCHRLRATTSCKMDLTNYPMDKQICSVIFENFAYSSHEILLTWHKFPIQRPKNMVLDGYKLVDILPSVVDTWPQIGDTKEHFRQLKTTVIVRRTYMYYIYRAYIPSILLQVFALGSFWVPDNAVPARMGMIVTSFLSNALILQSVTDKTVKVDYTTPMQLFLLFNVVVIALSMVEYLLILQLRRNAELRKTFYQKRSTISKLRDRFTFNKKKCEAFDLDEKNPMEAHNSEVHNNLISETDEKKGRTLTIDLDKLDENAKRPKKKRNMHILDVICQIVFPLTYFLFCVIYFSHYAKQ